ncbi:MAG: PolC-type DNA polymerase III [Lachnospiraceae bacterium]|nr:PolC-type DNA polymerase III [Lachnospiraceae bacterium]
MLFFEFFDTVHVDLKLKKLFEKVRIQSYKKLSDSNIVEFYLEADDYIPRDNIRKIENSVTKCYMDSGYNNIRLKISYSFAKGRSFNELWEKYHHYLNSEIYSVSPVFGDTYRNSKVSASDGVITVAVSDTPIIRNRVGSMCALIEEMWEEMFSSKVTCAYEFRHDKVEEDSQKYANKYFSDMENYIKEAQELFGKRSDETDEASSEMKDQTENDQGYDDSGENGIAAGNHGKDTGKTNESTGSSASGISQSDGNHKDINVLKTAESTISDKNKKSADDKKADNTKKADNQKSDKYGKTGEFEKGKGRYNSSKFTRKQVPKDDPDVFYARNTEGDISPISDIYEGIGVCVIRGMVLRDPETKETRNGKIILSFDITDFTYSIRCKIFLAADEYEQIKGNFKPGSFLRVKGVPEYDSYAKDVIFQHIEGIKPEDDFRVKRMDNADVKRIELHCHSKMSDMDGVASVKDLIKTALKWGHKGIALTDHGVVQGFTDALHTVDDLIKKSEGDKKKQGEEFKVIYGCEGYIVDDEPDSVTFTTSHGNTVTYTKQEDGTYSREDLLKMPMYHIILLAKNDLGRINLYRLVSESHLNYYSRRPRIPKSLLAKYREGIIVGSACEAGELFRAVVHNKPAEEVARIAKFYDYYEIQQIGNNRYMIEDDHFPEVNSDEDLRTVNRKIVELAEADGKLCIATCDVHFINPEDEVFRRVLMYSKGFEDADRQAPLFLHTTAEMIEECRYLGDEKAYEVVVTNPNKVFDMCDRIKPVRPDKCPPVIEDSDKTLREICERKVTETYGENLHPVIRERLDRELNSIIKNGFAVMYIIAQKLVWKSNEDGYLVGSRGSVGSSFVATMAGITEVNPLPAHYYCKKCHYIDFDSDTIKEFGQFSGFDLPDMKCPVCGEPLIKQGQNIPFETFLGFNGDKEPDIDLNFSGEYQSKAHDYTEVIFGAGQTFKAGTVGTVADKTAVAYARKYCDEHAMTVNDPELFRMASGCIDVKRTTGQHPGGIVVLPIGEDINTFTPVQHPANKDVPIVTTHFDYHSIDHNLLKLDILGHDDPTMIRMLEDLTGVDAKSIRMDNPDVISLFSSTEKLGIKPEDIDGTDLGSLGLPELGTKFVMQMLRDTKPKNFSDMMKISGLSHGTDVWLGNAQYYIQNGDCTLTTAICTRDEIMTYLIRMGIEPGKSFKIMEAVRKGKGLTDEFEAVMREHDVPEWYLESCKKIKYMFPKAHACAYIMMAIRIGYFKINYPLAYYAAYFSIRAKAFDYEKMAQGKEVLLKNMKETKKLIHGGDDQGKAPSDETETADAGDSGDSSKVAGNKDIEELEDMKIVQEMYARGYDFMPIDIYRAKARHFQIIDGKIMPSLTSIAGLGEKAAEQIEYAASLGKFSSKADLKKRCKIGDSLVALMEKYHIFGDLPESDQLSLFDWMKV